MLSLLLPVNLLPLSLSKNCHVIDSQPSSFIFRIVFGAVRCHDYCALLIARSVPNNTGLEI